MTLEHESAAKTVHVRVDRSKITSHGKPSPSLGRMLCRIHTWRWIADVKSCREYYDPLSVMDGEYEAWRQIVVSKREPSWKFMHANTFLEEDGEVELRVYEGSNKASSSRLQRREFEDPQCLGFNWQHKAMTPIGFLHVAFAVSWRSRVVE